MAGGAHVLIRRAAPRAIGPLGVGARLEDVAAMPILQRIAAKPLIRTVVLMVALTPAAGCVRGPAGLFVAMAGTALVTAAVVSAVRPPPPPIFVVPEPRPGYVWQPGYWTLREGQWIWIDGDWIVAQPGYTWSPAHWERLSDGTWRLVPGRWLRLS